MMTTKNMDNNAKTKPSFSFGRIAIKFLIGCIFLLPTLRVIAGEGLVIKAPDGWTLKQGESDSTVFKAVYRDPQNRVAMITVSTHRVSSGTKLGSPEEMLRLMRSLPNVVQVREVDSGKTVIASLPAIWVTAEVEYKVGIIELKRTYCFIKNSKLYTASASTPSKGKADYTYFSTVISTMDKTILNIRFKE